jgi:ADP-ribose pyrophosphatase
VAPTQRDHDGIVAEQLVRSETIFEGKLLVLRHDTVLDAGGQQRLREVVAHRGGVAVLALTADRRLLLVRQYRHAVGEVLLELPAGTLDRRPDGELEDPAAAARRELAEETGHVADEWRELGTFYTAPGFATERMHLFLATSLSEMSDHRGPAEDENIELATLPLEQLLALAEAGELHDAKTLVGVLWLGRLVDAGEV